MKGVRTDPFQLDAGVKSLKNYNFLKKCDKTRKSSRRKLILEGTSRGIKFRNERIATILGRFRNHERNNYQEFDQEGNGRENQRNHFQHFEPN